MVSVEAVIEASLYGSLAVGLLVPLIYTIAKSAEPALPLAWIGVALAVGAGIGLVTAARGGDVYFYGGLVSYNSFNAILYLFAAVAALLALWASGDEPLTWPTTPSLYSLLPILLFGMFVLAGANDALVFLAAWLLVSVASYVVIATPGDTESRMAAARYILMGALATLFIAAWLGVHVGITGLSTLNPTMIWAYPARSITLLAAGLILAGVGFKVGVVPFHWWLPSVYGKADGRSVAFVAASVKLAFIAFLVKLLWTATKWSVYVADNVALLVAGLAVLTMTYGNVAALTTRDLQRMLAYSSIAHIGYIAAGLSALIYLAPRDAASASLAAAAIAVHSIAYAMAKSTLFPFATASGRTLTRMKGLYKADPASALTASTLLLSLLGMPPLLGFWGKLFLILAAAKYSIPLVIAIVVNTGISAAYYVVAVREIMSGEGGRPHAGPAHLKAALLASALFTILLGLLGIPLLASAAP